MYDTESAAATLAPPATVGDAAPLAPAALAQAMGDRLGRLLAPLLRRLDQGMDRRLVRTAADTVLAIVRHRQRGLALLLSELGAFLAGPQHAPAGTKRLGRLLHSEHWQAHRIEEYLREQGQERVEQEAGRVAEGRALCILDGSVLEKGESAVLEGLRPVRSSKARRLVRPRPKLGPGYYRGKPQGALVVPGFSWVAVLVTGWAAPGARRPLTLGAWHWYSKPAAAAADAAPADAAPAADAVAVPRQREQEAQQAVLEQVTAAWGAERLLHVWDRGLSGAPWLGWVLDHQWHFVVRWKKGNRLRPAGDQAATAEQQEQEGRAAWRLTAGLRDWGKRELVTPRNPKQPLTVRFAARPVRLLHRDDPLWLVVVRLGKSSKRRRGSGEPWRLLTTEPVTTEEQCWRMVEAYMARWLVEEMLRFSKSELGVESVRVRKWEPRRKLLALVSLAYAFLIDLLGDGPGPVRTALLRWAHRTGRQAREAWRPLYRLRAGLVALWQEHIPHLKGSFP